MITEASPTLEEVASAVGVVSERVSDVEPPATVGAWASLTRAFRIEGVGAARPARVLVFTPRDPAWRGAVDRWMDDEVRAWIAWWSWVRDGLGRDEQGVWWVPPLPGEPAAWVRRVSVVADGDACPAFVRPEIEGHDLTAAGLPREVERAMAAEWRAAVSHVLGPIFGEGFLPVEDPVGRMDLRRRLITDGRRLLPTSFRPYLRSGAPIEAARPRAVLSDPGAAR